MPAGNAACHGMASLERHSAQTGKRLWIEKVVFHLLGLSIRAAIMSMRVLMGMRSRDESAYGDESAHTDESAHADEAAHASFISSISLLTTLDEVMPCDSAAKLVKTR